jgi:drug/metabolite transporter (DMT)-like permease
LIAEQNKPGQGIALTLLMAAFFALMDASIKVIGAVMPVLFVLWARYGIQAVLMAAWLSRGSKATAGATWLPKQPRFQLMRGVLLLITSAAGFYGVQLMPVAEFTAIVMLMPLIATLLAAWLLKEQVSRLRWAMVAGGFVGVLIVIRPGSGLFGWGVVLPLLAAVCYAMFQVLTRRMALLESPYTTHFWTGVVGFTLLSLLVMVSHIDVAAVWHAATAKHLAVLLAIGLLGTVGHLLLIFALGLAPASVLMPFSYTQIAMAAAVGWWVFGDVPDGWAWLGMGVVAACGATSAWSKRS